MKIFRATLVTPELETERHVGVFTTLQKAKKACETEHLAMDDPDPTWTQVANGVWEAILEPGEDSEKFVVTCEEIK